MGRSKKLSHKVLSIEPQKGKKNQYKLNFHSGQILNLSEDVLISHDIREGQELSLDIISMIKSEESLIQIREKVFHLLTYRDRSEKELETVLINRGFQKQNISIVLADLRSKGYLNDEKFARDLATHLINVKMLGRMAVLYRFSKYGIDKDVLNSVLNQLYDEYKPSFLIKRIIEKISKMKKIELRGNRKLIVYLKRKGFSWDEISDSFNQF